MQAVRTRVWVLGVVGGDAVGAEVYAEPAVINGRVSEDAVPDAGIGFNRYPVTPVGSYDVPGLVLAPYYGVVGKIVDPYAVVTVAQVPEAVRIGAD